MNPSLFPVATLTLMLWILWSDSIRKRPTHKFYLIFRSFIFLGATAALGWNLWRFGATYTTSAMVFAMISMAVGLVGVVYFLRRAFRGPAAPPRSS